jgi:hypothetical protein
MKRVKQARSLRGSVWCADEMMRAGTCADAAPLARMPPCASEATCPASPQPGPRPRWGRQGGVRLQAATDRGCAACSVQRFNRTESCHVPHLPHSPTTTQPPPPTPAPLGWSPVRPTPGWVSVKNSRAGSPGTANRSGVGTPAAALSRRARLLSGPLLSRPGARGSAAACGRGMGLKLMGARR